MSMPFNTNLSKLGQIEVFEDNTHFRVRIHPENRDRAKKISGRQWYGKEKVWVYPKDQSTYESLVAEFQKDADRFDIRRPKTQRPHGINPPIKKTDDDYFEDQIKEEISSISDIDESKGKIHDELKEIRVIIESITDMTWQQSRTLKELRETQEKSANVLTKFIQPLQQTIKTKPVEFLPNSLDLSKQKEIELIEKALIHIACLTANEDKSFCHWISKYAPLNRPRDFVLETHEFLKEQLGKIVGDEDPAKNFRDLVEKARDEKWIYSDQFDPIQPIPILHNLNAIRNRFGHSRGEFSESERWNRSILYLMNLALVWSRVVMKVEEDDE